MNRRMAMRALNVTLESIDNTSRPVTTDDLRKMVQAVISSLDSIELGDEFVEAGLSKRHYSVTGAGAMEVQLTSLASHAIDSSYWIPLSVLRQRIDSGEMTRVER